MSLICLDQVDLAPRPQWPRADLFLARMRSLAHLKMQVNFERKSHQSPLLSRHLLHSQPLV